MDRDKITSPIDDIIKQISSLFVFNTSMMFAAGVLYLYMLHHRLTIGDTPAWSYWSDAAMLSAVFLKSFIHIPTMSKTMHAQQQELLTAAINTLLHIGGVLALMTIPSVGNVVSFVLSFQPALLVIAMFPLIRKNRTVFYQELWGFVQYSVVFMTILWFCNACYLHYLQHNFTGIASNILVLMAPKAIEWIRTHHTRNISNKLHKEIYEDALTGLNNRRSFYAFYDKLRHGNTHSDLPHIHGGERRPAQYGLALFYIDVDHFKVFNDEYGHTQGDTCLVEVADFLRKFAGQLNMSAYRFGGEEFVVCGTMTQSDFESMMKTQIVSDWIEGRMLLNISFPDSPLKTNQVTISGGATFVPKELFYSLNAGKITGTADKLLYASKDSGRNTLHWEVIKESL